MAKVKSVNVSNSVIHMLHRASQVADLQFEQAAQGTGLTARQLVVLDTIARLEEPSQTDVCDATGIDRSTLADMVRRLCTRRLIVRRRSRSDARAYNLRLTEDGIASLSKLLPIVGEAEHQVTGALSEARKRDFLDLLQSILARTHVTQPRKPMRP